jgi:hypothetical protein
MLSIKLEVITSLRINIIIGDLYMDQKEYGQLLDKAHDYFNHNEYNLFLTEFAKCFQFNTDCFNDSSNVFMFSLSNYSLTSNKTINEYNRFILHFDEYFNSLNDRRSKDELIGRIIILINKKYNEVSFYDNVINYDTFNNYCAILMQLYSFVEKCVNEELLSDNTLLIDTITNLKNKIVQLYKVIRFTGTRYKIHFIFLPQTPKEFLKGLEEKIVALKDKIDIQ